ncbi:hypothetical protein [Priestia megaterium]|uniref:Flp family type IVb pilin n=2 Tax=Priestia megaterium TaxID=1404 RepID=A0A6M6E6M2_PRIMG|nr:hypothetical protein [Priestia megaterium]QJX80789.1 hypothetical protein FDZ14_32380 [Priestia megaterium]
MEVLDMVKNLFNQFRKEEDGGLVEYLILIAIAAVAAALLFPGLRKNLIGWFNDMVDNVKTGITGTTSGTTGAGATVNGGGSKVTGTW